MGRIDSCPQCGSEPDGEGSGADVTCYCIINDITRIIAKKHGIEVIALLQAKGPMRFKELIEHLDANSPSTLTTRLDELVEEGMVERETFDEIPPHVEYSLTERGQELETHLEQFREWAVEKKAVTPD